MERTRTTEIGRAFYELLVHEVSNEGALHDRALTNHVRNQILVACETSKRERQKAVSRSLLERLNRQEFAHRPVSLCQAGF